MLVGRLFKRATMRRSPAAGTVQEAAATAPFHCPICDASMHVEMSQIPDEFAAVAIEEHDLRCTDCGMLARRLFHPSVGYDTILVR